MQLSPFPNVFEFIRFIATSFDTKASNKQLDDLARDVFADYRQVKPILDSVVIEPLAKYVSPVFAQALGSQLEQLLNDYLELVSIKSVDGVKREQVLPVLVSHWLVPNGLIALDKTLSNLPKMPRASLLLGNSQRATDNVLQWADDNVEGWTGFVAHMLKEKKDQLVNWSKGKYLPDLQSINLLRTGESHGIAQEDCIRVISLLVLARGVDSLRPLSLGEAAITEARQQLMGARPIGNPFSHFKSIQEDARLRVKPLWPHLRYLSDHLRRTITKSAGIQKESRQCLDDFTCSLKALGEYEDSKHKVAQFEGRWHVFSGDLKGACNHYEQAVESALYRAGNELKEILTEAFCVAAKAGDSVLMRKVKNSQILFKLDLESVSQQLVDKPSKKSEQFVQNWEVKAWAAQFDCVFPSVSLFDEIEIASEGKILGSLLYDFNKKVKPDYRNPNKKIRVDLHKLKAWPQVCWFILMNGNGVVKDLIESGATMDIASSSGDTPLIMALENLVVPEIPYRNLDDTALKLVLGAKGVEKTVNMQTHKMKLLPIIQAVGSGRPDVVKMILDLGAEVDRRGESDNQTALNICIKWIGLLRKPEGWVERQMRHPITPELLDSLRRVSNGAMGASLDQQYAFLDPKLTKHYKSFFENMKNFIIDNMSIDSMVDILNLLLDAGANVNAIMQSPLPGYTPLMLAAELDLDLEFSLMLQYKPDLDKEFKDPHNGKPVNSWQVAGHHRAKKILKIMEDIKPYYKFDPDHELKN
jgi:ankyrin repeat protein